MNIEHAKKFLSHLLGDKNIAELVIHDLVTNPMEALEVTLGLFTHIEEGTCAHKHSVHDALNCGLALGLAIAVASDNEKFKNLTNELEVANGKVDQIIKNLYGEHKNAQRH